MSTNWIFSFAKLLAEVNSYLKQKDPWISYFMKFSLFIIIVHNIFMGDILL